MEDVMEMKEKMELNNEELHQLITQNPAIFLCGNGFSINFDKDFSNIYDRLYEAHKSLMRHGKYDVKGNRSFSKIFKDNYKNVCKYVNTFKQKDFDEFFESGVVFAESIIKNAELVKDFSYSEYIHKLTFGTSELDSVRSIAEVGKSRGYKSVNIEYWSLLIYMYFAINRLETTYVFPDDNLFITLIKIGNTNKGSLVPGEDDIHQYIMSNGLNTYYRMLFATAIWNNGKAVDFEKLQGTDKLNISKIADFLNQFKVLITLNYDHIIENIVNHPIQHIHGEFVEGKKEFVYFQSMGWESDEKRYISYSDILIGDYYNNKTFAAQVSYMNKDPRNKRIMNITQTVGNYIREMRANVIVIFGMSINNDQHIIRDVMLGLEELVEENPKIIYCYYDERDKADFEKQYESAITFSKEVNRRVREIEVEYIKTQDVLDRYFVN